MSGEEENGDVGGVAPGAPAAARSLRANKLGAGGRETAEKTLDLRIFET